MTKDKHIIRYKECLREVYDTDIVSHLILELMSKDESLDKLKIRVPLGKESEDLTFKTLGDLAFDYYYEHYDSDVTYGFSYSLEEL
tara:strand:- start:2346 stop:2603 length:258 start_codon:yes stop_codon:yes gene_type:complete